MSISVEVSLLSGRTATVTAGPDEDVDALSFRAQTALGVGKGRLVDLTGNFLHACTPIKDSEVQDGGSLILQTCRVEISAFRRTS